MGQNAFVIGLAVIVAVVAVFSQFSLRRAPEWQAAMRALMLVARGRPTMFVQIGVQGGVT
jgi:hypothetical protein